MNTVLCKKCTRCGDMKSPAMFQIRKASKDGLTAACKDCLSKYDKARANLPHRVEARNQYSKTDAFADSKRKTIRRYRDKNPKKYKAHNMVNNAIRDKKLFRECCEVCGNEKSHAHHDDYSKPLNVRFLCCEHHRQWHEENGEGKNPF